MKRILIGIPAFRIATQVKRCLDSLVDTGADVMVVDNAADHDVVCVIKEFFERGKLKILHRNSENLWCNGGWNQILEAGLLEYDIIGLGSSDVTMPAGWADFVSSHYENHPDQVILPRFGPDLRIDNGMVENIPGPVAGPLFFLPNKIAQAIYPIPPQLKMWFGDEFIFTNARKLGYKVTILHGLMVQHEESSVIRATPEAYQIIEEDKKAWAELHKSGVTK